MYNLLASDCRPCSGSREFDTKGLSGVEKLNLAWGGWEVCTRRVKSFKQIFHMVVPDTCIEKFKGKEFTFDHCIIKMLTTVLTNCE